MSASTARSNARSTLLIGPAGTAWPFVFRKQPGALFFEFDPTRSTVTWSSGNAPEVLGMREQAVSIHGAIFLAHVHPDDRFRIERLLEGALRGEGPYVATYRWIRPDTREVSTIHCRALLEADGSLFRGFFIDLSSEVSALQAGSDYTLTLGEYFTKLDVTGIAVDAEFRIRSLSRGTDSGAFTFGRSDSHPDEMRPGRLLYECFASPSSRDEIRSTLQRAIDHPLSHVVIEWRGYRATIAAVVSDGTPQGVYVKIDDASREHSLSEENRRLTQQIATLQHATSRAALLVDSCQELLGYAALISRNVHGNPIIRHAADALKSITNRIGSLARTLMDPTAPEGDGANPFPPHNTDQHRHVPVHLKIIVAAETIEGAHMYSVLLRDSGLQSLATPLDEAAMREALMANRFVRIVVLDIPANSGNHGMLVRSLKRLFPALHILCLVPGPLSMFAPLRRAGAVLLLSKPVGAREVERVIKGLLTLSTNADAQEALKSEGLPDRTFKLGKQS